MRDFNIQYNFLLYPMRYMRSYCSIAHNCSVHTIDF